MQYGSLKERGDILSITRDDNPYYLDLGIQREHSGSDRWIVLRRRAVSSVTGEDIPYLNMHLRSADWYDYHRKVASQQRYGSGQKREDNWTFHGFPLLGLGYRGMAQVFERGLGDIVTHGRRPFVERDIKTVYATWQEDPVKCKRYLLPHEVEEGERGTSYIIVGSVQAVGGDGRRWGKVFILRPNAAREGYECLPRLVYTNREGQDHEMAAEGWYLSNKCLFQLTVGEAMAIREGFQRVAMCCRDRATECPCDMAYYLFYSVERTTRPPHAIAC
ncbi:hypothetical protein DFJ77DRAFT_440912 [Powellomyces hirtus]|nr:hypothetical protein DFJ77DRAFT_440912 [Powellomyces hirtus]